MPKIGLWMDTGYGIIWIISKCVCPGPKRSFIFVSKASAKPWIWLFRIYLQPQLFVVHVDQDETVPVHELQWLNSDV